MNRRHFNALFAAAPLAGLLGSAARAQGAWPAKPVTVVVPFAPGGAGNGSVRILAEVIGPKLGQPIVVDNRPGGGSIPGTQSVAQGGDDHTLLMGSTTLTILPALRPLPYDAQRDLQPVGMISSQPMVLAVAADSPLRTLQDLVARGKTGELTAGNSGVGTLSHLATELVNRKLGTRILPVPYKGDSVLLPDVASGTISLGVINLPVAMPLIQSGRLRALAVTADKPVPTLPNVPLLKSLGPEFVITGWAALFASSKVPPAGVARFEALLREALGDAEVKKRFDAFGVTPEPTSAAQLRDFVRNETARWTDVVKAAGIRLE